MPPLCQVRFGLLSFVVNQAQPMRSESSKSVRGQAASAPGAVPSRTASSQIAMSWALERIAPAGAWPPMTHGAAGRPEAVNPWLSPSGEPGTNVSSMPSGSVIRVRTSSA